MGSPSHGAILRAPGRVSIDPSDGDFTGTWPFGGTGLGHTELVFFSPGIVYDATTAEEFGGETVEKTVLRIEPVLLVDAREWLGDALALWPLGTTARLHGPGTGWQGGRRSDNAVVVLFTPDEPTVAPAHILYRALPIPDPQTRVAQSVLAEMQHPFAFEGVRDSSGRVFDSRLLAALTYP